MTLIEVIVTLTVIGAIATVLAAAITVTFRQQSETSGSLGVARWEQALAIWLPTDLASADPNEVSTVPDVQPDGCSLPECSSASNALRIQYDDGSGLTMVSYRYGPDPDPDGGFVIWRVECQGGLCTSRIVLRDLAEPDDAGWVPGVSDVPSSVMSVSAPTKVVRDELDPDDPANVDNAAVTVNVTVNGLPEADGGARSSSVSVTVGGVVRGELDPPTFDGPNFVDARSACGGPHTLLVDYSGSINFSAGAPADVRRGVESFVRAFEGTPTQLKVVLFNETINTLGGADHTYDLSDPDDVVALVGTSSTDHTDGVFGTSYATPNNGTDWPAALRSAFYNASGERLDEDSDLSTLMPERVILFTDGLPTVPLEADGGPPVTQSAYDHDAVWYDSNVGSGTDQLHLRSWWWANEVANEFRGTVDLIGVGVGPAFSREIRVAESGWPSHLIPSPVFLGDLVAGQSSPIAYVPSEGYGFNVVNGDDGWDDVADADVLTTSDFSRIGEGLAAIALAECGGTLTVSTRDGAGATIDDDIDYGMVAEGVDDQQLSTTRISTAATFDVPFGGAASKTVRLIPQDLVTTGYTATGWSCRAGGGVLDPWQWSLIDSGNPAAGIEVTVFSTEAVSCTLEVA